jgi:hypothetical protein
VADPVRDGDEPMTAPGTRPRHRRTRLAGLLAVGLLAVEGLAGCVVATTPAAAAKGAWFGNATDLARAQRAWADPWAAPTRTRVAGFADKQSGALVREVGARAAGYPQGASAQDILLPEVRAAMAAGWRLVFAQCTVGSGSQPGVSLARGARIDDAMLATLEVSYDFDARRQNLTVTVAVPHHLDTTWSQAREIPLASTCLANPGSAASAAIERPPFFGPWGVEPVASAPEPTWPQASPPPDLTAAVATAARDPWLVAAQAVPTTPVWTGTETDGVRAMATSGAGVPTDTAPAAQVTAATAAGWILTYAACDGGRPVRAELRRDLGSDRYAVARVTAVETGSTVLSLVSTPGISPTPAPALGPSCLDGGSDGASGWRADGIPGFAPTLVQPLQP